MKSHVFTLIFTSLCILFLSASVQAVVIPLSTHSSNPSVGPGVLNADLDFVSMVLDKADEGKDKKEWLLTLDVANSTQDPDAFKISEIYFNTTIDPAVVTDFKIDGLVPGDKKEWDATFDVDNIHVANFGLFDIGLVSGKSNEERIESLQTYTFTIKIKTVFNVPDYTVNDFYFLSTAGPPGDTSAYACAKFFGGPGDASAHGAYVPEPVTISLFGLGGLVLLSKRRA